VYDRAVRVSHLVAALALVLAAACGGGGQRLRSTTGGASSFEPSAFLIEVGANTTEMLQRPEPTIDELETERDSARGAERRRVLRDLARAHMLAAEVTEGREQRRHRADAERFAEAAANGSRDDTLLAETAFVPLWLAWRAGDRSAAGRADRFTTRHRASGELALLAWIVRGEIAFAAHRWDEAITAYRYVLGQLGHPLYAYALYRTAQSHAEAGRNDEARQALEEVAALGCARNAGEPTVRIALQAESDLGREHRRDGERTIPSSCPEETARPRRDGEWTPDE
jgi:tetratricopeptide (TPR) repeat protein